MTKDEKTHTIQRRRRFCLVEKSGGLICLEGRNQTESRDKHLELRTNMFELTHHHRMQLVNEWDESGRHQHDQQKMGEQEIRTPEGHLHNLDDIFTSRLGECGAAQASAVPFTRPPCTICFIMLVLTSKEYTDEDLLDGTLDGNDGDDSENGVRSVPKLQEPLETEY